MSFNWKKLLFHRKTAWVALGVAAVVLRNALSAESIERYYSRGLFPLIRRGFDALTGLLPFALVYLAVPLLLAALVWQIFRWAKSKNSIGIKLLNALTSLLAFAGGLVFFFLALWGFNYGRTPLEKQIGIEPNPLTVSELRTELESATADVLLHRASLHVSVDSAISAPAHGDLESEMRRELTSTLQAFGFPTPGKMRGRVLFPKGILLRISTAGVYVPFTGEGHIDGGLHYLQLPFVLAHEMSHGYGFGDEGTCNFLAYLACIRSDNPYLQYVGHLYYWRYVAAEYRGFEPEVYAEFRKTLPSGLIADLKAIQVEMEKYPDILPAVRDAAYSTYLKAQGIEEGLKNYDRVIMLVKAWRERGQ